MVRRGVRYNLSQFAKRPTMAAKRRVVVRRDDVLVLPTGFEVEASILVDITAPDKRILWAFTKSEDGLEIRLIAYSEDHCIWLTEEDLVRPRSEVI